MIENSNPPTHETVLRWIKMIKFRSYKRFITKLPENANIWGKRLLVWNCAAPRTCM